jgi:hypothetical protein
VEDVGPDDDCEFGAGADEPEEQLLAGDEGEDPRRTTRSVSERSQLVSHGRVHTAMSSKARDIRRRHSTGGAALRSGDATMEEPLMFRRAAAKRANDVVETTIDHPFGCGRREESSSLLLLSS